MALNHTHKAYENYVLAAHMEDQLDSKLDLLQFCTVDNSLVGVAGDKKVIRVYSATNGTEKLAMGEGNTKDIEVSYEEKEYAIELLQNRFSYFDEEAMAKVKAGIDPINFPTLKTTVTSDESKMINFDKQPKVIISLVIGGITTAYS